MHIKPIIPGAVFVLGFATAWVAKPAAVTRTNPPENPPATRVSDRPRPARGADKPRSSQRIDTLVAVMNDKTKTGEAIAAIRSEEFPGLLEGLARRSGFTGLDYSGLDLLNKLVMAWHDKQPDEALAWVRQIPNAKDRQTLLSAILSMTIEKDLQQGLVLMKDIGRNEKGGWIVPYELYTKLGRLDADAMLDVVSSFVSTDGSGSQSQVAVPGDFDFRKALDGLVRIRNGFKKGENFAVCPDNLLSEWAKRDSRSAWDWVSQNKDLPFASVGHFLAGYRTVASTSEVVDFLAETTPPRSSAEEDYRFRPAWETLAAVPNAGMIGSFIDKLPGDRIENLSDLFFMSSFGSGGRYDEFKEVLLQQMTPDERMAALQANFKKGHVNPDRGFYEPILRRLGHSDEEIQRLLPNKTGN